MNCSIIDIGSNSMRLTAYEVQKDSFRSLFRAKVMAGLASYVEKGCLTEEGIARACGGLLEFRDTLEQLEINHTHVFATASLREVKNTQEAVCEIDAATGYRVEVLSGEEEALYGCTGALWDLQLESGVFVDIGGASTELALFSRKGPKDLSSYPVGSLSLFRECVKKLLPTEKAFDKMHELLREHLGDGALTPLGQPERMACSGGTCRAALKLAKRVFCLPQTAVSFSAEQLFALYALLRREDKEAVDLILKTEPERIHTLLPGMTILCHLTKHLGVKELFVSKYGVREGYLCQRIQTNL